MALGSAGCLLTEKPDFKKPESTQPYLANVSPPTSKILEIPRKPGTDPTSGEYVSEIPELSFDVHSEDLQRPLYVAFFIDFPRRPVYLPDSELGQLGTGTLEKARPVSCALAIPSTVEKACHSITALVSHNPSIFLGRIDPAPSPDLATQTWWAQIGFDSSKRDFMPCEPEMKPADAGNDARVEGGAF